MYSRRSVTQAEVSKTKKADLVLELSHEDKGDTIVKEGEMQTKDTREGKTRGDRRVA